MDGSFSAGTNSGSCALWSNCSAGTYVSNTPSATADRICTACPAGQTNSGQNATSCVGTTSISGGLMHTCALVGGGVQCWGDNHNKQLGDDAVVSRAVPGPVSGLALGSGVTSIAAGDRHTCVAVGGGVKCWGENYYGTLGDGTNTNRSTPAWVSGLGSASGATAIAASGSDALHMCAVVNGGAQCWGYNGWGQLGDGLFASRATPAWVAGLGAGSGVTAIGIDLIHTCAVVGGGVKCWGGNVGGQLGDGTTTTRPLPTQVNGLTSGATAVATGYQHTCALVDGAVKCWGDNGYGQLGDGTTTSRTVPGPVSGLASGVTVLASGLHHACAVAAGALKCWGYNGSCALGDGTCTNRSRPVTVFAEGTATVGTGPYHTCAWTGGQLQCWGNNSYGELGIGTMGGLIPSPTLVHFP